MASLLLVFLSGCSSRPVSEVHFIETEHVILGPGDVLNVQFSYTPELNSVQMIRPDGRIALQLIGEVEVSGKTPQELQKELLGLYSKQLKLQEITVIVDSFYSNRVYVSGAVNTPGLLDFPGRMTAFEAVMESGGFDFESADVTSVQVLRYENGIRHGYELNFEPILEGKESPVFFLQPYDVVYVPEKSVVRIARWITQHIDGLLPQVLTTSAVIYIVFGDSN